MKYKLRQPDRKWDNLNARLIDQLVHRHLANGTEPHPPTYPIDPEYAEAYDRVVEELATLRTN